MNVKLFLHLALLCIIASCKTVSPAMSFKNSLFRAYDHTAENAFTENVEGPATDKEGKLYVVNYNKNGTVGIIKEDGSNAVFAALPEKSVGSSIQFNRQEDMLVADVTGRDILLIDMQTKRTSFYCHNNAFNEPNDFCINRKGQLFVTDPDWKTETGKLWRINENGTAALLKDGLGTTNGICFSPDGKILYVNESVQRKVWAFTMDEKGNLAGQRLFTSFNDYSVDGMKCDYKGNLYVCRYGKGAVAIFNPIGEEIQEVMLKGKKVTNLAFGGGDNKTCYVTLQDRKCIEKFRTDVPGK